MFAGPDWGQCAHRRKPWYNEDEGLQTLRDEEEIDVTSLKHPYINGICRFVYKMIHCNILLATEK